MVIAPQEAEVAMHESEERWRMLAEALPLIVWSARADGYVEYQNSHWYAFSGLPEGSLGNAWEELVHPDDLSLATSRWEASMRTGMPFELEYRMRRKDGAYRWLLSRGLPMRHADGRTIRWLGTCTDVSDIVATRDANAREADRLEQMVAERTRDLQETQARLVHAQRMEALGQLAGGIAHDFNNVLQAVQGGAALIEQRPDDVSVRAAWPAQSWKPPHVAWQSRADCLRFRAIATCDPSRWMPRPCWPVWPKSSSTLSVVRSTCGWKCHPGLPQLLADKSQLETVLINLATNARDAMQGSGTLILAAAARLLSRTTAHVTRSP